MYLVNNFGPLVILSSLLAFTLVPGITPPLASAQSGEFSCAFGSIGPGGEQQVEMIKCSGSQNVCMIDVTTGTASGCGPGGQESCGTDPVPQDGKIYCAQGTKDFCCCIDPANACNNHTSPETKVKICAVPELQASRLCCTQGACTTESGEFSCYQKEYYDNGITGEIHSPCHEPSSVCWISTETGQGKAKCQPESIEQCGLVPVPQNGSIYCAPGTKHCCCADSTTPATMCNKHTDPEIKARICAVPELKKSELCCEENGGCTSGKPPTGPGGPGGSSSAAILSGITGFVTGTVGWLAFSHWLFCKA